MANLTIREIKEIENPTKRGDALFEARKYKEAADSYLDALMNDTGDVSLNMKLGESYLKSGNYLEAKQTFEEISRIKPDHVLVRNFLKHINVHEIVEEGDQFRKINDYQKALETYYKAFKIDPNSVEALYGTAQVYLEQNDTKRALQIFDKIVGMDSLYQEDFKHILNHVAINLGKQGFHKKTVGLYQKAITIDPEDEVLYFNLAKAFIRKKDYQEAKKLLMKALEIDSSFSEAKELLKKLP